MAIPANAQTIIDGILTTLLGNLQSLEVHQELGLPVSSRTKVQFAYCPMITHKGFPPRFFYNGSRDPMTQTTDFTIDATNSLITLTGSGVTSGTLTAGNEIKADYFFQYFSEDQLFDFVTMGLHELNVRKPNTAKTFETLPLEWNTPIALYALSQAIQTVLNDTTMWRPRIIFADPQSTRDQLSGNLTSVNTRLDFLLKVTKRRGEARPRTLQSSRIATQQVVNNVNWHQFALQI